LIIVSATPAAGGKKTAQNEARAAETMIEAQGENA
jgi:hypothetical protein